MSPEPMARGSVLRSFRDSARERWGDEGIASIAERLGDECRAETVEAAAIVARWMPERFVLEWAHAVYEGPAQRDEGLLCAFAERAIDFGFGRIQRFMLGVVSPSTLVARASSLWSSEHDQGTMTGQVADEGRAATIELRDHPYVHDELARPLLAASLRRVLSHARGGENATAEHSLERDVLVLLFRW